jgi:predicted hydrolase (HD superfamily)
MTGSSGAKRRYDGAQLIATALRLPFHCGRASAYHAGMPLDRATALAQLHAWTETASLRGHARAVEIVMRAAATRYGGGEHEAEHFGLAGLLHDADYEKWPEEHPARIVAWLRDRGETALADAIAAHYTRWGVPAATPLAKALVACDELTGFVVACAYVRPDGIAGLAPSSVKKKLKDKSFAAKVDRDEVAAGTALLGVDLDAHAGFIIEALKPYAAELGLAGRPAAPSA